jgi:hypothetical protein
MSKKNKIYIVKYSLGTYDDYREEIIFATIKKTIATKYVTRFNKVLKQLEEDNKRFEKVESYGLSWIKDKYAKNFYRRWSTVREINKAFWEESEIR